MEEGQILNGTVIDITPDHVTVDVGYKCEGQIPIREFQKRDKKMDVKIGDRIEVFLEKKESEEGLFILSKEKADKVTIWRDIGRSYREGEVIEGEIVSKVKGGLSVDIGGVIGFLPGSQIDLKPIRNLDELVGKRFKFKVIKLNRKRNNVVLSRRVLLEEELKSQRDETLKNLAGRRDRRGHREEPYRLWGLCRSRRGGWSPPYHRHRLGEDRAPFG